MKTEKSHQKIHPISWLFPTLSLVLPNVLWEYKSLHPRPLGDAAKKQQP